MAKTPARIRATSRLLALEPRLLFDGAAGVAVEQATHDGAADVDTDADHAHPDAADAALDAGDVASAAPTLVFIDSRVPQYADLAAELQANGADVHVIEQDASGLQAVGDALAQAGNVGQLQIIGMQTSDGDVQLGSDRLAAEGTALAADQGWDYYLAQDAAVEVQAVPAESAQGNALPASFSRMMLAAAVPAEGSISESKNTSDDGKVTVGENDAATAVAKDWEVKGSGSISVTVGGSTKGTLSHTSGSLSFTGTASEVNNWLDGVRYAYTGSAQTGDTDSFTLDFTTYAQDGSATQRQQTQAIGIAPQNDAPVVAKNGQTIGSVAEGGRLDFGAAVQSGSGFTHALLGITDVDNLSQQVIIKIETLPDPTHGSLVLNMGGRLVTLAVGSTLSVADLQNLSYVHTGKQVSPANGAATPLQSLRFTIDDGAGGRLTAQEVSIQLTPVNQAPAVAGSVTIIEGEKNVSLGAGGLLPVIVGERGQIAGTDPDDSQLSYTITALPTVGTLSYDGLLLTSANIARTAISDLSKLTYSYPEGSEPKTHGGQVQFTIQVKDSGGGAGAGAARVSSNVVSLTILDNNDDPVLSANVQQDYTQLRGDRLVSNNSFTITASMLAVTDPDSFDNHLVFNIKNADTAGGYFTRDGKLLVAGTSFTMQDVRDGKIAYHLRGSSSVERIDSFSFTVTDSATGVLFYGNNQAAQRDGGIYDSALPTAALKVFTFSVKVPAAERGGDGELPGLPDVAAGFTIGGSKTFTLLESAGSSPGSSGYTLTQANLNTTDGVSTPDKITYRLEELPASGTLYLEGRALNQFDSFTQADINAGKVVFAHAGGEQFSDLFRFSVSNGSIATDALSTVEITITPQNDTPTAAQRDTVTLLEGKSVVINGSGLGHIVLSDSDQAVAGANGYANRNELWLEIVSLPSSGKLYFTDTDGSRYELGAGAVVTQAQLSAGRLSYQHDGNEVFADSFSIRPIDNQNVSGSVGATRPTSTNQPSLGEEVVIAITIAPENDAPQLDSKSHLTGSNALFEGNRATIYGSTVPANAQAPYGQLAYADPDNSTLQIQFRVTEATQHGQLYKGSVALKVGSVFTQADLDAGLISYVHNGGEQHADAFKYLVSDGDFTVNDTGVSSVASVFNIELKPSNDTPVFSGKPDAPILVDGTNAVHNKATGFQLSDPDLATLDTGEFDRITAIVRVVDGNGNVVTWGGALGNVTLRVDNVAGVNSGTNGTSVTNDFLQLTGKVADVNRALATLAVGFSTDLNAKYQLQVIADDRLDAAGKAYQNGGTGVIANGGERNHVSAGNTAVDATSYDWATAATSTLQGSHNLAIATAELWVSTVNEDASLSVPGNFQAQEDVPLKLSGISVVDKESETFGTNVTLTLAVGSGTLSANGLPSGITVSGNASGTLTLTGSATALQGFLSSSVIGEGVHYTSAKDVNHDTNGASAGDVTLTVTLKEGAANSDAPAEGGSAIGGDVGNGSVENAEIVKTAAIVINAINDAPTVTAPTGNVSVNSTAWVSVGKFTLGDTDSADGYVSGETDGSIEVTVRLLDNSGNPLAQQRYADLGIQLGSTSAASGVVVDSSLNGASGALQLRGTLADIQAYLDGLQVQFTNATSANVDATYRVEVIVDDRLRAADGALIAGQANGGTLNQNGTNAPLAISTLDNFNVYTGKVAEFKDGGTKVYNVVSGYRNIFVSSVNDPAQIGIGGAYEANKATLEATETAGKTTVMLDGLSIRDSDAQGAVVEVKLTLPEGFSFTAGAGGVISAGGKLLTLTGTLTQINAAFKNVQIQLPDTASDAQAEDWNGSFSFEVAVNDRGNTGVTSDLAPADANGNRYSIGEYNGNRTLVTTRDITFVVKPTNDAPVVKPIDGGTRATLPTIAEDHTQTAAPGAATSTVESLFGKYFDDSRDDIAGQQPAGGAGGTQADSFHGIAITGNAAASTQGRWQYHNGTAWVDIPTNLSATSALILAKDVALQFIPAADWHGTPGVLTARLIETNANGDTTSTVSVPASGSRTSISNATGESSRYSATAVTLGITVTPVNDAPVATPDTHSMTENTASVTGGLIKQPTGANKGVTGADSDKDTALDANEVITVTEVKNSDGVAGSVAGNGAITVAGKYGSLVVQPDGSYTYQLRTNDPEVNKLIAGENLTESFGYTITDTGNLSASSTLTITITGNDDGGASFVPTGNAVLGIADQVTVKESGLAQGTGTASDATATGTLNFNAGNGLASVRIGTETLTLAQLQAIASADSDTHVSIEIPGYGTLVVTGFRPAAGYAVPVSGSIDYRFTLTHAQAHVGSDADALHPGVTLRVTDAGGKTSTGTLLVNIVDDVPSATADTNSVTEGATLTVDAQHGVLANDQAGADGWTVNGAITGVVAGTDTPAASGVGSEITGLYGTLTLNADGSYSYVARQNSVTANAQDVFTYLVQDADGDTSTATLTIDVGDVTGTPTETTASVNESGVAAGSTPGTGHTASGNLNLATGWSVGTEQSGNSEFGSWSVGTDGKFSYTLTTVTTDMPDAEETDSFSYISVDQYGNTVLNTVVVSIVDDVPTATADTNSVTEGATLTVDAQHGVLANDQAGADGWTVNGAITGVVAGTDTPAASGVGSEITGLYGTLTLNADGSYSYVVRPNSVTANAQDVFTYLVQDADGDFSTATLTIDVGDVTGTPTQTTASVNESGLTHGSTPGTGHTASGNLNLATGWSVGTEQSGYSEFGTWSVGTNGKFSYTLTTATTDVADAAETDSFSYTSVDQYGNTVTSTVVVTIVDDVPTATADTNSVTEGATLTVDAAHGVLANDKAGADGWTTGGAVTGIKAGTGAPGASGVGSEITGLYGKLTLNANGSYSYVARPDAVTANAQDVFTYTVTDADGDTSTTTLTINVGNVTGTPTETTASVKESGLAAGSTPGQGHTASGNLTLATGWRVGSAQSGTASFGTWSVGTDGKFSYTLTTATTDVADVAETDSFSYTSVDQYGNTVTNTVVVAIVDDMPTANADSNSVTEGATLTVDAADGVLANDESGADGWKTGGAVTGIKAGTGAPGASGVGSEISGLYGKLTLNANGSYRYVARPDAVTANAQDVFTYTVTDADGDTSTTTLTINVGNVTGTPTETTASVNESGLAAGSTPGQGHTASGNLALATGWSVGSAQSGTASFGSWSVGTNGKFSYTLTTATTDVADVAETDSFSYTSVDQYGNTVTNTVVVTIVDDMPMANADTNSVTEGATLTVDAAHGVLANDKSGADGWKATGAVTGVIAGTDTPGASGVGSEISGLYGKLTLNADGSYSYVARPDAVTANAQDVFTYTVTDADGDASTTTLTINVGNVTGTPTETTASVNESGLAAGSAPGQGHSANGNLTLAAGWSVGSAQSGTASFGSWSVGTDGKFSYTLTTPTRDVAGTAETDSFSYTSVDQYGNTVTNTVVVAIVDDVPTANADTGSVSEGATLTVDAAHGVLANDKAGADGWNSSGAVTGVKAGTGTTSAGGVGSAIDGLYGKLTLNADGSYSYVARPNAVTANAQDVFTYTVTDADGDTTTATLTIHVSDITGTPTQTTASVNESGLAAGSAPGQGHSANGNLTLATGWSVGSAQSGTASFGSWSVGTDGKFRYTLTTPTRDVADTAETDSFSYTSVDQYGNTVTNTVVVAIVDDVPTANADTNSVTEGATLTVDAAHGVLANDQSGADGWKTDGAVTGVVAGTRTPGSSGVGTQVSGLYGTLKLNADGSYSYAARPDATTADALDTFTYTVTDADGDTATTTLTIAVGNVTGTPTRTTGASVSESGLANGSTPAAGHTASGDLNLAAGWSVGAAQSGSSDFGNWSVGTDGKFSYTLTNPATDVAGAEETDSFSYTSVDQYGNTVRNTVVVAIVDDMPSAKNDSFITNEDQILTGDLKLDHSNGKDLPSADGNTWTLVGGTAAGGNTVLTTAQGGSVTLHADGTFSYVPVADWHGTDSFSYAITDGDGDVSTATVTITVVPVVDIAPDTATTHAGQPVTTTVLDNDSFEGQTPVVSVEPGNGPAHGSVSVNADGSITYQPTPGYVGQDQYTYTVTSGGVTETATVTVEVTNTPPVANDDRHVTAPGMPASGNVLTGDSPGDVGDSDPNGDPLSVTQITVDGSTHAIPPGAGLTVRIDGKGTLEFASDGSYTFTPDVFWGGEVPAIGYTISDGNTGTATATLQITATAAPQAPQVTPATPGEIPTDAQQPERPLFDPAGSTRWKGDAAREPSVFWENQSHDQIMRLPLAVHPITYVNRQVQSEQADRQLEAALGTDPTLLGNGAVRSQSIGSGLGQDPQLHVQHAVRGAQGEGHFWQLKAWRNAPNLPVQTPADALELEVPGAPADAAPAGAAPAGAVPTASAEDALLQRWAVEAVSDATEAVNAAAATATPAVAADSFSAQIRAQAGALPSHMS